MSYTNGNQTQTISMNGAFELDLDSISCSTISTTDFTATGDTTVNNFTATGTVSLGSLGTITQTGTEVITQSGTGTNTLKAINMVSGTNITMTGGGDIIMSNGGRLTQPSGAFITQSGGVSGGSNTMKNIIQEDDCSIFQGVMSNTLDGYNPNYLIATMNYGGIGSHPSTPFYYMGKNQLTSTNTNNIIDLHATPPTPSTFTDVATVFSSINFSELYNCNAFVSVPISMGLSAGSINAAVGRVLTYTFTISNVRFDFFDSAGTPYIQNIAGEFDFDTKYSTTTITKTYSITGTGANITYSANQFFANACCVIPMTTNFYAFMMNVPHNGFRVDCKIDFDFSFAITGSGVFTHTYTTQTIFNTTQQGFAGTGALVANSPTGYVYESPILKPFGDVNTTTKMNGLALFYDMLCRGSFKYYQIAPHFQTIASAAGNSTFNPTYGSNAWITGSSAFTLTLPTANIEDGEIIYLRKISSTAFVITLSYTATFLNASNASVASPNATSFLGTVFEIKIIYRQETNTWSLTVN